MAKNVYLAIAAAILLPIALLQSAERSESSAASTDSKSHFAKIGTNKVHYVIAGKGKHDLVLIHCWAGNIGFWNEQIPALKDKARLILIDLPGHGKSDKPQTAYTMDYFAQAVLAVMKDAHVANATLIGHSMGAAVIARVYKQARDKVAGLVAVDGVLRRPKWTAEQSEQFIARFRSPDYKENIRQFMSTMFPTPGTEAIRDRVTAEMLATPQYVMVSAMDSMFKAGEPDWDPVHVNAPVLVINAPNRMWTDEYKDYVRGLSAKSDYRAIDGTGHWLMLEKPAEFNAALTEMLARFELIDK